MSTISSILQDAAAGRARIMPWTVEQYHAAIDNGFIPEDTAYELIDGFIVGKDRAKAGEDPMTIGDRHALVIQRLVRLAPLFDPFSVHLRLQAPISLPPTDEPEPDGAVIDGNEDLYAQRRPAAREVHCVIEVADSSLSRDLGTKLKLYASAGIPVYIVIDLVNDRVLVHMEPQSSGTFSRTDSLNVGDTLQVPAGPGLVAIPVARLLR